ncbi:SDR family NAD(P)-dependent oxidoreductase [Phenylobacterium sp.]|jgi:NAD(P)-dependent dehydrogenase (short-subunit alcohol dehydrogenase family)|uniref:SDR family NAD(P)-dependent oxidoreductase n=1 Tax=Phenylobacterium sp. TaxID=1871053 RepID=UPI002F41E629
MAPRGLFDLTGKVVVSTGANSGIGLGFLQGCAKQGADVVVWGRRADRNAEALAALQALGAGRGHAEAVDVADEAAVVRAMAGTVEAMGRVDCVFANAGISSRAPSFPDMTSEMYHALLNVNLHGAFYTLREASRHMRARAQAGDPGGSIVACGSLAIFRGYAGLEHYGAAKSGVAAMIKGLAVEMGPYGVRANMIAAGLIRTAMTDRPQNEAVAKQMAGQTPLGRCGEISDIEGPAAYLASDASAFHTGDILVLDGGRLVNS